MKYVEDYTGFSSDPTMQDGNFIALQWDAPAADITSCMVGLEPSYSGGLVETINDPDHNGVFKIHDTTQVFKVVQSDGTNEHTQTFSLSGLTLADQIEG